MDTTKLGIEKKFMDMMHLRNFSEATKKSYSWNLDKFIDFKKDKHVSILSSQDINDYLLYMVSQNAGSSSLNQAINAIRFFFTFVLNRKIKGYLVVRPKKEKRSPILLSDNELGAIFDVCVNKKHKAIIALMYGAGLRVSEVVNLKISHIDSECMLIYVISGKGKKDRAVMLDQKVLYILEDYFEEYEPVDYLFNGQDEDYSVSSIQKFVKKYQMLAGITKKVHPHLFRHNFATGVLENGGSLYDAQVMLGHEDPRTTANFYAHLLPKYLASIKSPISNLNLSMPRL